MAASREPMSNVDTAWLRMEHPTNLMMISGILVFDAPIDFDRLRTLVKERLLIYDRFRQKVLHHHTHVKHPEWVEDTDFDLDRHLVRLTLPESDQNDSLLEKISELMSEPLDYDRPLWQFHIIENYKGGCVVIGRIHHCIGDGTVLIRVLLSLTDEKPDGPGSTYLPAAHANRDSRGRKRTEADPRIDSSRKTWRYGVEWVRRHHRHDPAILGKALKMGAKGVVTVGKLAFRPTDPKTRYRGALGKKKLGVWSKPISLTDIKAIGKATGGTVNDVLITAMLGALRRYLEHHGDDTAGLDFHAAVPVNLRPPTGPIELGNHFGLVFPLLPVGVTDPMERIRIMKERMEEIKNSPEAMITLGALYAAGVVPQEIQDLVVNFLGAKTTAVMTNVPGPRQTLYMAGAPLRHIVFWVPQSGRVGLGISIMSYDGEVTLGVACDAALVPDPERIIDAFHEEFDALRTLAGLPVDDAPPAQQGKAASS